MKYLKSMTASEFAGKTITSIIGDKNSTRLQFVFDDNTCAIMEHQQDCCETVSIEDIVGDLADLIDSPLLQAECVTSHDPIDPLKLKLKRLRPSNDFEDSETWTFYKFATIKGSVTIRWYGTSNGYYSEGVDITLYSMET